MAYYVINNRQAPIDFECGDSLINRTIQNAKNLLMTQMGEVPYDRYRGMNPALYDLPIKEMREALLPEMDRVMLWEPDVEVADAECSMDENGEILIVVTLEIDLIE
ncbi:MAG: hypothetical protein ACOYI6_04140 [Christensenellales bacterium]|jgi:hypothetical protein